MHHVHLSPLPEGPTRAHMVPPTTSNEAPRRTLTLGREGYANMQLVNTKLPIILVSSGFNPPYSPILGLCVNKSYTRAAGSNVE